MQSAFTHPTFQGDTLGVVRGSGNAYELREVVIKATPIKKPKPQSYIDQERTKWLPPIVNNNENHAPRNPHAYNTAPPSKSVDQASNISDRHYKDCT